MKNQTGNFLLAGLTSVAVLLLAGCASTVPAPLIERASPQAVEKPAAIEVKPGYYLVKRGDTLRSIALDHGQDYKDIAAWNSLDNPNLIKVDQILRVSPPETGAVVSETHPVAPPTQIETRPVDNKPLVASDAMKREPKGGTQSYTDDAWAQLQKPVASSPAVAPPSKTGTPVSVPIAVAPANAANDISWAWPSSNKVTTPYSEGASKGLDFDGKLGDVVLAAASGKVTLVTNSLRGYGNLIVVKHNSTYLSVYAHNSKMLVSEGQSVSKGQKIAEIGSTDTDRPNLHFEIRREGKPIDPARFLSQR